MKSRPAFRICVAANIIYEVLSGSKRTTHHEHSRHIMPVFPKTVSDFPLFSVHSTGDASLTS